MTISLCYFISDLHLSEDNYILTEAFDKFISYCLKNKPKSLYILGDLFDYYLGFDVAGDWGGELAGKINCLVRAGIKVYFLPGNRDFLIDKKFLEKSAMVLLGEPSVINLDGDNVMLSHGDYLCINDCLHQYYRRFSQLKCMKVLFLLLSKKYRVSIAKKIRQAGRDRQINNEIYEPVESLIVKEMKKLDAKILIHGHIHRPIIKTSTYKKFNYQHIVLPDWREHAELLIYNLAAQEFSFKTLS